MNPPNPKEQTPEERRQSFRCPAEGLRRHGRLRVGRREVGVRFLDESTGGFAVESDDDPGCQIGDTLLCEIALAWVEVRVINVDRGQPGPDDSQDAVDPPPTRISLQRVRDVDEWEVNPDERPLLSWSRIRSSLVPLVPLGRSFKGTLAMIATIIAAGVIIVVLIENLVPLFNAMRPTAHDAPPRLAPAGKPIVLDPIIAQSRKSAPAEAPPPIELKTADTSEPAETESAEPPPTPKPRYDVPKQAMRLVHPDFLLKPQVAEMLSLRRNQRDELRRIYQEHQAAADGAPLQPGADEARNADDSLVRLGRKSLEVLSDEQRELLTKLHAAMESSLGSSAAANRRAPSEPPAGE